MSAGRVSAQDLPSSSITGDDIRQALIWTGYYSALVDGDRGTLTRAAWQKWQKSKGYAAGETPTADQAAELMAEGSARRESFGWATLRDRSIGFSVGVPTRLAKFLSTRTADSIQWYDFEGSIGYSIGVQYGMPNCATMGAFYTQVVQRTRTTYHARQDNWFVIASQTSGRFNFSKVVCSSSGILFVNLTIPLDQVASQGVVIAAVADSVVLSRNFDTTGSPHPKLDEPSAAVASAGGERLVQPRAPMKLAAGIDTTGKTGALKRETWNGAEMRAEEVFAKAGGAVYMVRADKRQGSAVAISDNELLTNCHVVGDLAHVVIVHDKQELPVDVVSGNATADRCVLHSSAKLASWASVRPYDDIKIGERAFSIGTPHGLELTVAEGLVSSKRAVEQSRLIQTSAPVSPGSSGGGLFDAEGHLLGITTFQAKVGQNLNFAVAAEEYAK